MKTGTPEINPLPSSDVRRVFPPFIEYTKPENTYLSFQVTFKTEILCKYPVPNWLKRTHDVIMSLHNKVMSVPVFYRLRLKWLINIVTDIF